MTHPVKAFPDGVAALVKAAATLPGIDTAACTALSAKIEQHAFHLVVAGEFKRGKSSVINALLGADLLPTGVVPLTSAVTLLHYGEAPVAMVVFEDGERRDVPIEALPDFVTEKGILKNAKGVREVAVAVPAGLARGRHPAGGYAGHRLGAPAQYGNHLPVPAPGRRGDFRRSGGSAGEPHRTGFSLRHPALCG